MKQSMLLFFIIFLISSATAGYGQVTITAEDFDRQAHFVDDAIIANTAGVNAPSHGADQTWDYSMLTTAEYDTTIYQDAANHAFFPNALNYKKNDLIFQGFIIETDAFEDVDEDGYSEVGRSSQNISYSITAISGGPTDTLAFVSNHEAHEGRFDYIQFPLNYEDEWNQTRIETFNFELTIAAFGLDHTPGSRKRHITQNRQVVGHGQLIIPTADGSPSTPMDVLLVHVIENQRDSFYVGGNLAPAVLLTAFGLAQGMPASDEFYVFYRPGFAAPIMNYNIANSGVYYRPRAAEGISAIRPINKIEVNCYPNPIAPGERLTFLSNENIDGGQFQLINMMGQVVYKTNFTSVEDKVLQLDIPVQSLNGIYSYRISDEYNSFLNGGAIVIE